jgi:Holliday junction DNA helicase RuvA
LDKVWLKLKKDVTTADSVDVLMKRALQMLFTG